MVNLRVPSRANSRAGSQTRAITPSATPYPTASSNGASQAHANSGEVWLLRQSFTPQLHELVQAIEDAPFADAISTLYVRARDLFTADFPERSFDQVLSSNALDVVHEASKLYDRSAHSRKQLETGTWRLRTHLLRQHFGLTTSLRFLSALTKLSAVIPSFETAIKYLHGAHRDRVEGRISGSGVSRKQDWTESDVKEAGRRHAGSQDIALADLAPGIVQKRKNQTAGKGQPMRIDGGSANNPEKPVQQKSITTSQQKRPGSDLSSSSDESDNGRVHQQQKADVRSKKRAHMHDEDAPPNGESTHLHRSPWPRIDKLVVRTEAHSTEGTPSRRGSEVDSENEGIDNTENDEFRNDHGDRLFSDTDSTSVEGGRYFEGKIQDEYDESNIMEETDDSGQRHLDPAHLESHISGHDESISLCLEEAIPADAEDCPRLSQCLFLPPAPSSKAATAEIFESNLLTPAPSRHEHDEDLDFDQPSAHSAHMNLQSIEMPETRRHEGIPQSTTATSCHVTSNEKAASLSIDHTVLQDGDEPTTANREGVASIVAGATPESISFEKPVLVTAVDLLFPIFVQPGFRLFSSSFVRMQNPNAHFRRKTPETLDGNVKFCIVPLDHDARWTIACVDITQREILHFDCCNDERVRQAAEEGLLAFSGFLNLHNPWLEHRRWSYSECEFEEPIHGDIENSAILNLICMLEWLVHSEGNIHGASDYVPLWRSIFSSALDGVVRVYSWDLPTTNEVMAIDQDGPSRRPCPVGSSYLQKLTHQRREINAAIAREVEASVKRLEVLKERRTGSRKAAKLLGLFYDPFADRVCGKRGEELDAIECEREVQQKMITQARQTLQHGLGAIIDAIQAGVVLTDARMLRLKEELNGLRAATLSATESAVKAHRVVDEVASVMNAAVPDLTGLERTQLSLSMKDV